MMAILPLLTVEDVAKAMSLTPATVRDMFRRGDLPGFRVCGHWRIQERSFNDWVASKEAEWNVRDHAVLSLRNSERAGLGRARIQL